MSPTRLLAFAAAAAVSFALTQPVAARIGVVMMHGNGSYGGQFEPFIPIFKEANFGLQTPDMCWAGIRHYDRTPADCMADVDAAIARLKAAGYDQIVVAGHSMGGINTLLYAANHQDLAGVVVFAPSARPSRGDSDPNIQFARKLVADGLGDKRADFPFGGINPPYVAPRVYLSYFGPESLLYDTALLPKLSAPLLWVAGTDDNGQRDAVERYRLAPPTPLNRFILVKADHYATPDVAARDLIHWLNELQASLDKAETN